MGPLLSCLCVVTHVRFACSDKLVKRVTLFLLVSACSRTKQDDDDDDDAGDHDVDDDDHDDDDDGGNDDDDDGHDDDDDDVDELTVTVSRVQGLNTNILMPSPNTVGPSVEPIV